MNSFMEGLNLNQQASQTSAIKANNLNTPSQLYQVGNERAIQNATNDFNAILKAIEKPTAAQLNGATAESRVNNDQGAIRNDQL